MASFFRYKSEGLIKEISTNVVLTCLLSLCDRSLVICCNSVLYFAIHSAKENLPQNFKFAFCQHSCDDQPCIQTGN